jgi:hypothetical protein
LLQSCIVTKGIRYGNASVDDYSIFEQDSVINEVHTFRFAEQQHGDTTSYQAFVGYDGRKWGDTHTLGIRDSSSMGKYCM